MVAHQPSYSAVPPRFLEVDHKYKAYIWFLCGFHYLFFTILARLLNYYLVVISTVVLTTPCQCRRYSGHGFESWVRKIPTPVILFGESCGQGNLAGHSLWGCRVGHNPAPEHPRSLYSVPKWKAILFQLGVGILGLFLFVAVYLAFVLILCYL